MQELWQTDDKGLEYKFIVLSQQQELSMLAHYAQCFVGKYRHAIVLHDESKLHAWRVKINYLNQCCI